MKAGNFRTIGVETISLFWGYLCSFVRLWRRRWGWGSRRRGRKVYCTERQNKLKKRNAKSIIKLFCDTVRAQPVLPSQIDYPRGEGASGWLEAWFPSRPPILSRSSTTGLWPAMAASERIGLETASGCEMNASDILLMSEAMVISILSLTM